MWQITWMLGLLPDWFWTLVLIAGILGIIAAFFLKFVPVIKQYSTPIKIASVIMLLVSVYFQGVIANEEKWQARIKELEAKLAIAEQESKKVNTVIVEKIVKQKEFIKGRTEVVTKFVDREVVKDREVVRFVEFCPLPPAIIEVHNAAAEMNAAVLEGERK